MTALFDNLQVFFWIALVLAGLYAAWRVQGVKGVMAMTAALFLFALYRKGRSDGRQTNIEKERADADHAVRTADAARVRAGVRDADPERLRDDDGFRRD